MLDEAVVGMHEHVAGLADEIASELLIRGGGNEGQLREEIHRMKLNTANDRNPDVAYATMLFRRFAITSEVQGESHNMPGLYAWFEEKLNEPTGILIVRALATLFALLTFSVMSSTPYINNRIFKPNHHFHRGCEFKGEFVGQFNFRPYHLVIAAGVIAFVVSAVYLVHPYLPKDGQGRPQIPGLRGLVVKVMGNERRTDELYSRVEQFWEEHGCFVRMLLDVVVLILALVSLIAAVAVFQRVEAAQVGIRSENPQLYLQSRWIEEYYTLTTCYLTYSKKTPVCLDKGLDPTPKITAALVMLFFCSIFLFLCVTVTWREFRAKDTAQMFAQLWTGPPSQHGTQQLDQQQPLRMSAPGQVGSGPHPPWVIEDSEMGQAAVSSGVGEGSAGKGSDRGVGGSYADL